MYFSRKLEIMLKLLAKISTSSISICNDPVPILSKFSLFLHQIQNGKSIKIILFKRSCYWAVQTPEKKWGKEVSWVSLCSCFIEVKIKPTSSGGRKLLYGKFHMQEVFQFKINLDICCEFFSHSLPSLS